MDEKQLNFLKILKAQNKNNIKLSEKIKKTQSGIKVRSKNADPNKN